MQAMNIRPVSDLSRGFGFFETAMRSGPVVLTKDGYGAAVMMTIAEYERLVDPMEAIMDETDRIARSDPRRFTGEEVYQRIKSSIRHVRSDVHA